MTAFTQVCRKSLFISQINVDVFLVIVRTHLYNWSECNI